MCQRSQVYIDIWMRLKSKRAQKAIISASAPKKPRSSVTFVFHWCHSLLVLLPSGPDDLYSIERFRYRSPKILMKSRRQKIYFIAR
jgi:hypothetical protein